jgi:hypothetical protein
MADNDGNHMTVTFQSQAEDMNWASLCHIVKSLASTTPISRPIAALPRSGCSCLLYSSGRSLTEMTDYGVMALAAKLGQ